MIYLPDVEHFLVNTRDLDRIARGSSNKPSKRMLFIVAPGLEKGRRLFASQDWVDDKKREISFNYNNGENPGKLKFPLTYWFRNRGRIGLIIADGHHRTADALGRGLPIIHELEEYLGTIDTQSLSRPDLGARRLARYGMQGIWPFNEYMHRYHGIS